MPADPIIFGRESEVRLLDELLDRGHPQGGALLLRGDPGIGKSALLDEAARRASDRGMLVLLTTGVQSETQMPFAGVHQLLRPLLGQIAELPEPERDALLAAFGSSTDAPDLFLVALAALNLLSDSAARTPILLIADDVHWMDSPSCDVLAFLALRLESEPIVLLVSSRAGAETALDRAALPELSLHGLDPAAAGALLDAQAPDLTTAIRERLLAQAAGNPLALVELPIAWRGQHEDPQRLDGPALTERLERAFAARAQELPEVTRTLLLVAALNDEDSLAEALEATAAVVGREPTMEDLAPAETAGLIDAGEDRLRFRHPLIRSAIRQAAGGSDRYAAHAALAGVLAGDVDRAVWHRAAAAVGPDEEVAAELEATALRAQRQGGIAVALAALRRAAELSGDPARRGARLVSAAELGFELGRNELVTRLLEDAESLELATRERHRILCLRESLRDASGAGTVDSSVALADQMIAAGETEPAMKALLTAAYKCYWFGGDQATRERAVSAAERVPVSDDDATLLTILAFAAPLQRGALVIDRLARAGPDAYPDPEDARLCGVALTSLLEYDLAMTFLSAAIDGLRSDGRLALLARALQSHAWCALWRGRWNLAIQSAEEATRLARETAQPRWAAAATVCLAQVVGLRGGTERAEALLTDAERVIAPTRASPTLALIQSARAGVALSDGRDAEAFEHARRMFDPSDPAHDPRAGSRALVDLADAAVRVGQMREARAIFDELEPLTAQIGASLMQAALSCARPLLAGDDEAESLFKAALGGELAIWPYLEARLQLAYGVWLRGQRRGADSRAPLRAALKQFDSLGAEPCGERARQQLRASGETSRRRSPDTRDDLTPQELQIVQMAAEGLSNREIGQRLFLSHRTIGSHLYRAFPKLGISSRSELRHLSDPPWSDSSSG